MTGCATALQRRVLCALFTTILALAVSVGSASAYNPIIPTKAGETVTLNGRNLTIEQVVDVARHGAKVRLTNGARQRSEDAY